jgi:hypothetical protein
MRNIWASPNSLGDQRSKICKHKGANLEEIARLEVEVTVIRRRENTQQGCIQGIQTYVISYYKLLSSGGDHKLKRGKYIG